MKQNKGFSLIELLVVLAISSVMLTGIYSLFFSQHKAYEINDQVAAMQQNIRAAMYMIERDLHMAGYDPTLTSNAGITVTANNSITFTIDQNADGDTVDTSEQIAYLLYDVTTDTDTLAEELSRAANGTNDVLAQYIQAIDFVYYDARNQIMATPVTGANLANIRSISVTILAKTERPDRNYNDAIIYNNGLDPGASQYRTWGPFNDGFRRRALTLKVKCRNLGI